jgi:hypothetical protein
MLKRRPLPIINDDAFRKLYDIYYCDQQSEYWVSLPNVAKKHKKFNWLRCLLHNGFDNNLGKLELKDYKLQHSDFRKLDIMQVNFAHTVLDNSILPRNIDNLKGLGDPAKLRKLYSADEDNQKCMQPYQTMHPQPFVVAVDFNTQPRITDFFSPDPSQQIKRGHKNKLESDTNPSPIKKIKTEIESKSESKTNDISQPSTTLSSTSLIPIANKL